MGKGQSGAAGGGMLVLSWGCMEDKCARDHSGGDGAASGLAVGVLTALGA